MMEQTKSQYIPGVCNIGPAEIKRRKQAAWIGFAATVVLWGILVYLNAAPAWRLLLFLPAVMSAFGFIQAYMRFCIYYGFAALFNFGDVGRTDTVQQAEFRARDKRKAWQITVGATLVGVLVAVLAYMI